MQITLNQKEQKIIMEALAYTIAFYDGERSLSDFDDLEKKLENKGAQVVEILAP
jgi:hypothetical protein